MKKKTKFKRGTAVVFDPKNLNKEYWEKLSEEDRVKRYGPIGYGSKKKKFFIFLTEIRQCPGHCVLVDMKGNMEVMWHTSDFREATEEEL